MTTERRNLSSKIELRTAGGKTIIRGFAARYGTLSSNLGGFRETIAHGAFRSALTRGDDVRCLFNHSADHVLGRTKSHTLRLKEMCSGGAHENCGLFFECDLPDTSVARDLRVSIERGDISGCSFAFSVPEGSDSWDEGVDENGLKFPRRTLRDVNPLLDCSVVCYPAYPDGTSVDVDTLAPSEMLSLQVAPRALQEARSRGGYAPKPKAPGVLVDEADRVWIMRENARKLGIQIADDDSRAYLNDVAANDRPRTIDPLTEEIRKAERKANARK
jgi:HK97 family phage prohead protease